MYDDEDDYQADEGGYLVERGIPIPTDSGRYVFGQAKYPFGEMEVGDSFETTNPSARSASYNYGKRHNMTFQTRAKDGKFRIWRVQ